MKIGAKYKVSDAVKLYLWVMNANSKLNIISALKAASVSTQMICATT
nr:hypothetical protein [uncultured Campylobacter sp.]